MERSDIQFKAFIRFLIRALCDVYGEADGNARSAKLASILDDLQATLCDAPKVKPDSATERKLAPIITRLREAGWEDKDINDFLIDIS